MTEKNETTYQTFGQTPDPTTQEEHVSNPAEESSWKNPDYRKRWISLIITYTVVFFGTIQNSMMWSSLWPYISQVDPTATENFFGYVIMAYNLGSALSGPLYGYWSNKMHQVRVPVIVGISLTIGGNLLLAFTESFIYNRKWVILVARLIIGIGNGNASAMFGYIVMATTVHERNKAVSLRSTLISSGLIFGPAFQVVFVPVGYPGVVTGNFHLDMYTTPAFTNAVLGLVQLVATVAFFKEYWISVAGTKTASGKHVDPVHLKPFDMAAVVTLALVRFSLMFCFTYDSTLGSPFTMVMFRWSREDAVFYNGLIQVGAGVLSVAANFFLGTIILKYVRERIFIMIFIIVSALFFIIAFPWPGLPPLMDIVPNITDFGDSVQLTTPFHNITDTGGSCHFEWCSYTTRITFAQYLIAYGCMVLGFFLAMAANAVLFSKIIGPRKQGTISGIFQGTGKLGMTVSPVISTSLFTSYGPRAAWGFGFGVLSCALGLVAVNFKRLIPWMPYEEVEALETKPLFNEIEEETETRPLLEESLTI